MWFLNLITGLPSLIGIIFKANNERKIAEIESTQRKKQECLFCKGTAKRLSKGVWQCKKCNKKFAAHTYFLPKKEE